MDLERYKPTRHGGIIDYARTHLDTFTERPLGAVDSLILSWASYLRLPEELAAARGPEGVRIAELHRAEYFEDYVRGVLQPEQGLALLTAMTASPRFRDVRLTRYTSRTDADVEMQFSAMTFLLPDGAAYVAFRGTDSSLVGWKEDFNTSFECPVPSQVEAADYLAAVAGDLDGGIITGGHSKGGNLAVYAAATVAPEVRERVVRAYSHDGPGFLPEVLATSAFVEVAPKVCKTVPQSSVIGMLLEQQEGYRVVRSRRPMLWQHDPLHLGGRRRGPCLPRPPRPRRPHHRPDGLHVARRSQHRGARALHRRPLRRHRLHRGAHRRRAARRLGPRGAQRRPRLLRPRPRDARPHPRDAPRPAHLDGAAPPGAPPAGPASWLAHHRGLGGRSRRAPGLTGSASPDPPRQCLAPLSAPGHA